MLKYIERSAGLTRYPNSRFWVAASFATLLPPMRWLVCCKDRLNPSPLSDTAPLVASAKSHPSLEDETGFGLLPRTGKWAEVGSAGDCNWLFY